MSAELLIGIILVLVFFALMFAMLIDLWRTSFAKKKSHYIKRVK